MCSAFLPIIVATVAAVGRPTLDGDGNDDDCGGDVGNPCGSLESVSSHRYMFS